HGVREGSDGKIYIEGSNDNLRVHEIRHVAQALASGNMSFDKDSKYMINPAGKNIRGQAQNEIDGYKAGYSVDGNFSAGSVNHIDEINVHKVGNITDSTGKYIYPNIKKLSDHVKKSQKKK